MEANLVLSDVIQRATKEKDNWTYMPNSSSCYCTREKAESSRIRSGHKITMTLVHSSKCFQCRVFGLTLHKAFVWKHFCHITLRTNNCIQVRVLTPCVILHAQHGHWENKHTLVKEVSRPELHLHRRPFVDDVLDKVILWLIVLVDLPFHVLRDELHEQLVDRVFGLNLNRHWDEEGDKEENTACERHDLLRRQVTLLVAWKLLYLAIVREKAHDRRDGTGDHHYEVEEEYGMQDLVLAWDVWKVPVVRLELFVSVKLVMAQFTSWRLPWSFAADF